MTNLVFTSTNGHQVSISEKIATAFGFRNRMNVNVSSVSPSPLPESFLIGMAVGLFLLAFERCAVLASHHP